MSFKMRGLACWNGTSRYGRILPYSGHQRDDLVHVRIGIDIVQPHPYAETAERLREFDHARLERLASPEAGTVLHVHAVGAGILRDDEQLAHAALYQVFRLLHHLADVAAHEVAAHGGDDAECAAVVAALGDFQIRAVSRREFDARGRNQIGIGIMWARQVRVHRRHHLVERMRAGHRQHLRVRLARCRPWRRDNR